jgi:hypothetical protein
MCYHRTIQILMAAVEAALKVVAAGGSVADLE